MGREQKNIIIISNFHEMHGMVIQYYVFCLCFNWFANYLKLIWLEKCCTLHIKCKATTNEKKKEITEIQFVISLEDQIPRILNVLLLVTANSTMKLFCA